MQASTPPTDLPISPMQDKIRNIAIRFQLLKLNFLHYIHRLIGTWGNMPAPMQPLTLFKHLGYFQSQCPSSLLNLWPHSTWQLKVRCGLLFCDHTELWCRCGHTITTAQGEVIAVKHWNKLNFVIGIDTSWVSALYYLSFSNDTKPY